LLHPGLLLPALIFIVGLFADRSMYLLWSFDEFTSWGSWAKQIFIADTFWREDMETFQYYPKGWPLAITFTQFPSVSYDEFRGIALLAIFDDWTISVLEKFENDERCKQNLSNYFLVKINDQFKCFSKISN